MYTCHIHAARCDVCVYWRCRLIRYMDSTPWVGKLTCLNYFMDFFSVPTRPICALTGPSMLPLKPGSCSQCKATAIVTWCRNAALCVVCFRQQCSAVDGGSVQSHLGPSHSTSRSRQHLDRYLPYSQTDARLSSQVTAHTHTTNSGKVLR